MLADLTLDESLSLKLVAPRLVTEFAGKRKEERKETMSLSFLLSSLNKPPQVLAHDSCLFSKTTVDGAHISVQLRDGRKRRRKCEEETLRRE